MFLLGPILCKVFEKEGMSLIPPAEIAVVITQGSYMNMSEQYLISAL